jgi:hypothetical protein
MVCSPEKNKGGVHPNQGEELGIKGIYMEPPSYWPGIFVIYIKI